jgi:hypothetical protein
MQKLDDKTGKTSPNTLLEAAKDQLSKVLVLGIALDGSLYVSLYNINKITIAIIIIIMSVVFMYYNYNFFIIIIIKKVNNLHY